MGTSLLSCADSFDVDYPEDLGDCLAWLGKHLRIPRGRILRLMGFSGEEASALGRRSWQEIAQAHEAEGERAEHLLTHYLACFDHDADRARAFARRFPAGVAPDEVPCEEGPGFLLA